MVILFNLLFLAIGMWGSYQLGMKAGHAKLWNQLATTPRKSLLDLL